MICSKENSICPECGLKLIDDYWDTVQKNKDGTFTMDAFEAWVCPNRCGYYIRKFSR